MAKDEQRTCSIDGCGKALRASNTKGICGPCQAKGHGRYTVGARKTTTTPKAATPKPASAPAPKLLRWKEAPGNVAPVGTWDDLVRLEDEELLELRSRVDVELTRRLEASEARVDRLRSAVAAANAERRVSA